MEANPHILNACYFSEFRGHLEAAGWEVVEFEDTSKVWAEGVYTKANDIYLPILEKEANTLDPVEVTYLDLFSKNKPKIYADLRHLTVEVIRERFP